MPQGHPGTVPFRPIPPKPLSTYVSYHDGTTAIARLWAPGDAARCDRCPKGRCNAGPDDICLVHVTGCIPPEKIPSYRLPPPPTSRDADGLTG